ncbi:(S)-benzoin forming benzil reductase [Tenuibacillus multivorans]|uniref:Benzil reductase ((S)-benzoin forming) n=1 Tax=Tenuibacillus multivorans TaxID=237069 RepID=A0A1G9ZJV2_9BACI|nr:(S)-benzoin forming benzil reductase [Tenuibacillus multivorans]GEL77468.1 short-chain dehydrogenase [Tenuibacillus multivorans]SDN21619.1 benzil reductase ((S)-benzoin forming) [Tenuibacillus multivorans]
MKFAIVTGASRGLGEEVAKNLLKQDYNLMTISRKRKTNEMKNLANENRKSYYHYSCDLSDLEKLNDTLHEIIRKLHDESMDELLIVNNAGMVSPIGPVGTLENHDIVKHVSVNLTALMLIVNTMKKHITANRLFVTNISSGAGERGIYGWNAYCSTKSAVNMFTETAAIEAEELNSNDLYIAFSPGIMDTDMQKEIRSTDEESFKNVEQFKQYKEEGQLRSPKEVADILMKLITQPEQIDNGKVYRVYDLV